MKQYDKSEPYGLHTITVKGTTNTGTRETATGTVQTGTLTFLLDGTLKFDEQVSADEIPDVYARGIQAIKEEIDQEDAMDVAFKELEFTLDDTVDTPTNFIVSQPGGPGTDTVFAWDIVPPVDVYIIEGGTAADYSDALFMASGDMTTYSASLSPGMRYFRIKAQITGMTDSDWATTSLNVL